MNNSKMRKQFFFSRKFVGLLIRKGVSDLSQNSFFSKKAEIGKARVGWGGGLSSNWETPQVSFCSSLLVLASSVFFRILGGFCRCIKWRGEGGLTCEGTSLLAPLFRILQCSVLSKTILRLH